jgi:hypothetical protein
VPLRWLNQEERERILPEDRHRRESAVRTHGRRGVYLLSGGKRLLHYDVMIYGIELAVTWATISKDGRQGKLF